MKKLHYLFIPILFGLLSQNILAQESVPIRIKELYLSGNFLSFNNLGIQYKSQLNNGKFFRIGLTDISASLSKQNPYQSGFSLPSARTEFSGTFEIGLEKRAKITERLSVFYGLNFVTSFSFHRTKTEDPSLSIELRHLGDFNISPGLGFNSGFICKISNEFSASAEISPKLLYNYTSFERIFESAKVKDTTQGVSFNFNNQSVRLSLIYSWFIK